MVMGAFGFQSQRERKKTNELLEERKRKKGASYHTKQIRPLPPYHDRKCHPKNPTAGQLSPPLHILYFPPHFSPLSTFKWVWMSQTLISSPSRTFKTIWLSQIPPSQCHSRIQLFTPLDAKTNAKMLPVLLEPRPFSLPEASSTCTLSGASLPLYQLSSCVPKRNLKPLKA